MVNPDGAEYDLTCGGSHAPYCAWRKNRQPNCSGSPGRHGPQPELRATAGAAAAARPATPSSRRTAGRRRSPRPRRGRSATSSTSRVVGRRPADPGPHHVPHERPADPLAVRLHEDRHPARHDRSTTTPRSSRWARRWPTRNGYKAEQSSDLYITDGDQIDWMYGRQRIFSFTCELYPPETSTVWGDHYPADEKIAPADRPQPGRAPLLHRHRRLPVPGDRQGEAALRAVLRRLRDLPRLAVRTRTGPTPRPSATGPAATRSRRRSAASDAARHARPRAEPRVRDRLARPVDGQRERRRRRITTIRSPPIALPVDGRLADVPLLLRPRPEQLEGQFVPGLRRGRRREDAASSASTAPRSPTGRSGSRPGRR